METSITLSANIDPATKQPEIDDEMVGLIKSEIKTTLLLPDSKFTLNQYQPGKFSVLARSNTPKETEQAYICEDTCEEEGVYSHRYLKSTSYKFARQVLHIINRLEGPIFEDLFGLQLIIFYIHEGYIPIAYSHRHYDTLDAENPITQDILRYRNDRYEYSGRGVTRLEFNPERATAYWEIIQNLTTRQPLLAEIA